MHDTMSVQEKAPESDRLRSQLQSHLVHEFEQGPWKKESQAIDKRGRPATIQEAHLWLSLLWSMLLGMKSFADWWRLFCTQTIGGFAPIAVSVDALTTRLEQGGLDPLQQLARYYSTLLAEPTRCATSCLSGSEPR
jgi:hypothetical protein